MDGMDTKFCKETKLYLVICSFVYSNSNSNNCSFKIIKNRLFDIASAFLYEATEYDRQPFANGQRLLTIA
jgi:hypothetical protein